MRIFEMSRYRGVCSVVNSIARVSPDKSTNAIVWPRNPSLLKILEQVLLEKFA